MIGLGFQAPALTLSWRTVDDSIEAWVAGCQMGNESIDQARRLVCAELERSYVKQHQHERAASSGHAVERLYFVPLTRSCP